MIDYGRMTEFQAGDAVRVVELKPMNDNHLRKLTAFGLLPGTELTIVQTFPAIVINIGHSQFALDYEMASLIMVKYDEKNRRQGKK